MNTPEKFVSLSEVKELMPQQDPFLFLGDCKLLDKEAFSSYLITGKEDFLKGHFKDNPVFPASIMLEAVGQLAILYMLKCEEPEMVAPVDTSKIFFSSCESVRCSRICKPGDLLDLRVVCKRLRHPIATFEAYLSVNGERACFAEKICLTFDFKQS